MAANGTSEGAGKRGSELPQCGLSRRQVLAGTAGLVLAAPLVARHAEAQGMDLGPYQKAKINWRQCEGQTVNVAVIPATYYQNLIDMTPEFQALTGIKVNYDKVPPGQIRQKVVLDLSSHTGNISTHAADPMYIPLYAANKWCDTLNEYLASPSLTDNDWFNYQDIIEAWRNANLIGDKIYGLAYQGEMTLQIYRKDLYDAKGLKPAETYDELVANAKALNDPANRMWGFCMRGMAGAGQNMYLYPSISDSFGAKWFDASGKIEVNSPQAQAALAWYVDSMTKYAPKAAQNWNWPDIADAFSQGTIGCYIDGLSGVGVLTNPERSKVVGKIGFARWPKGPTGRRVTALWDWAMPINAALPEKARQATWLWLQWACSAETQWRTATKFPQNGLRFDVTRSSIWNNPDYRAAANKAGYNIIDASLDSLKYDIDVDWRPRVPEWPAIGETMGKLVQSALVGEMTPKQALDVAQKQVERIMSRH